MKISKTTSYIGVLFGLLCGTLQAAEDDNPQRWEKAISAFEKEDKSNPPPKNANLFVGSSSIRLWNLKKHFPDLVTINRGFGGSQMSDTFHFADRIVYRHGPKNIIVYAGDNDIAAGESPEQVFEDFKNFVHKTQAKLPAARIIYIAIKPSLKRWKLVGEMRRANKMIAEFAKKTDKVEFVDIDKPMIGSDGIPKKSLFAKDGLHLNEEGYKLWSRLVRKKLRSEP